LKSLPLLWVDAVYINPEQQKAATRWLQANWEVLSNPSVEEPK
jgi:hypothetical protein